jgi:hypothetical protein
MATRKKTTSNKRLEDAARRGEQAERLSKDPLLLEALQWMREQATAKFQGSTNPDKAWHARLEFHAMDSFAEQLLTYVKAGRDAAELLRSQNRESALNSSESASAGALADYLSRATAARTAFAQTAAGSE